jgi:hypothetical protein
MPLSPSFKIAAICDSVNLDFLIVSPLAGESMIPCVWGGGVYKADSLALTDRSTTVTLTVPIERDATDFLSSHPKSYYPSIAVSSSKLAGLVIC